MNRLITLLFMLLTAEMLFAQAEFSVSVDKPVYQYGEEVHVAVSAVNRGERADTLIFTTCAQADYLVDGFDWAKSLYWCQAFTYRIVPPHDSAAWGGGYFHPYPPSYTGLPPLGIGMHSVIGRVGSYWTSDTVWITVSPVTGLEEVPDLAREFSLGNAHPNPFNPATTIEFSLPRASSATLVVFNLLGEEVATLARGTMEKGSHTARWDAGSLPSGVYYCRLQAGSSVATRALLLLR